MSKAVSLTFRVMPDGEPIIVAGRDAWALAELLKAGEKGCTPIDNPGPRWSGYIFNLRQSGLAIETVHERHSGQFPGTHARYVLKSEIAILESTNGAA